MAERDETRVRKRPGFCLGCDRMATVLNALSRSPAPASSLMSEVGFGEFDLSFCAVHMPNISMDCQDAPLGCTFTRIDSFPAGMRSATMAILVVPRLSF